VRRLDPWQSALAPWLSSVLQNSPLAGLGGAHPAAALADLMSAPLDRVLREVVGGATGAAKTVMPSLSVDIAETATAYTVKVDVPGVEPGKVSVEVDDADQTLHITAVKETSSDSGAKAVGPGASAGAGGGGGAGAGAWTDAGAVGGSGAGSGSSSSSSGDVKWHRVERSRGQVSRSLSLPDDADAAALHAKVTNGVLTITIPKKPEAAGAAASRRRRVDVSA